MDPADRRPYFADAVFGDFDNDGGVDCVVLDRSESQNPPSRAVLFTNRGDGTFEPRPTGFSGLDGSGICGEAADLNNDGLLDLVFAADPDNSRVVLEAHFGLGKRPSVDAVVVLPNGVTQIFRQTQTGRILEADLADARARPAPP